MSIYINKDVDETLDYVFIRDVDDNIVSVSYTTDNGGNLNIISCTTNSIPIIDSNGNTYPANRAIVLWLSGGTIGTKETINLLYTTVGGRTLDENVIFSLTKNRN